MYEYAIKNIQYVIMSINLLIRNWTRIDDHRFHLYTLGDVVIF